MKTETKQLSFELKQLTVPPGNTVQLKDISWQTYENILEEIGEGYAARLPQSLEQSKTVGRNASIKAFRNWVREKMLRQKRDRI